MTQGVTMIRTAPPSPGSGAPSRPPSGPGAPVPRTVAACCYCYRVRGEDGIWRKPGNGFRNHPLTRFKPSICPPCMGQVREQMGLEAARDHPGPAGPRIVEPVP